jgi:hypothetical protein
VTTGAILIASGRVPNTTRIFIDRWDHRRVGDGAALTLRQHGAPQGIRGAGEPEHADKSIADYRFIGRSFSPASLADQ